MGRAAKIELLRRLIPLALGVLGAIGWLYFLTVLSCVLCFAAAVGIYAAMPRPNLPAGAIRPEPKPGVLATDLFGFAIGVMLFSVAIAGSTLASGAEALVYFLFIAPASFSVAILMISVRHETSWVRFFGNGFEFAQFGLRMRVPYTELEDVRVRLWQASGLVAWFQSTLGSNGRRTAVMLSGEETTKTLVFTRKDGTRFTISSEIIPDLQRILIGMDRAGIELPQGIGERQRVKIRRRREKLYGGGEGALGPVAPLEGARIAALIEHARRMAAS